MDAAELMFEKSTNGSSVLVIRDDDAFSAGLNTAGIETISLPLLTAEQTDVEIPRLSQFDGIIVTSRHAARPLAEHLQNSDEYKGKIYILGERSYELLKDAKAKIVFDEDNNTAEEMFDKLGNVEFAGKKLIHLRGDKSVGTVAERTGTIAELTEVVVYRTVEIRPQQTEIDRIRNTIKDGVITWVAFFSPSGVAAFDNIFGKDVVKYLTAAVIGTTTKTAAANHGFTVGHVAEKADAAAFADGLAAKIKGNKQ